ncbi:C3HC zinc finger-like-domain-containing protein [Apodospora peruviana]|uniref:C3HC zinc finger-like-domain-containing protein n=1 Tax=Apodospora peruviana TaxID=516989 RepID=A0AAE0I072_9PEZI|nr:C3HC zinc finger-like-domain-containing protein [Apodospora peruviana]
MNATVKRKFNALLQGIGSTSSNNRPTTAESLSEGPDNPSAARPSNDSLIRRVSTSSSRMETDNEFLNKKRRVGGGGGATSTKYGALETQTMPSRGLTTISNITLRKWTTGKPISGTSDGEEAKDGQLQQQPKYCPGDREQLLRRLATFQELTDWTPKPDPVNEVEWAKRGWVCQGKERVRCTLCSRELVVKLNRKEVDGKEIAVLIASEIAQSVVDMYRDMMVTSHAEDCLWRRRGCDDSLLRLPLPNPKLALKDLRQRYDELCERSTFLPYEFNLRLPEGLNLDVVLTYLPHNFFTEPPPPINKALATPPTSRPPPNRSALTLAILGWQGLSNARIGPVPNSASCHTCLRRLGLWMFRSKEVDPETNQILVPAPMDHLDPLREHRFFCPWKNHAAQRNSGARPSGEDKTGWEILVQVLRNEAFIRQRTSVVHSRSKSSVPPQTTLSGGLTVSDLRTTNVMKTPERRPLTSDGRHQSRLGPSMPGGAAQEEEGIVAENEEGEYDEEIKKKKDQAMMSRLRRVKSLFGAKAGSKLKRLGGSRPGTAHSTASKAGGPGE